MVKQEELGTDLLKEAMDKDVKLYLANANDDLKQFLGVENAKITMQGMQ
ncbi:hypothetical protein ACRE1U_04385 [Helicobacter himalayensis]